MSSELTALESTVQPVHSQGITWLNVERPTKREINQLAETYQFLSRDCESVLDRSRPSGLIERPSYDLAVLQIPTVATSRRRSNPSISLVSLFIGKDFVVTVHSGEIRPMLRLFREFEANERDRDETFRAGTPALVFAIVQRLIDATVASRGYLERAIVAQEEVVNDDRPNGDTTGTALRLRREVLGLRRIAVPILEVIRRLQQRSIGEDVSQDWQTIVARLESLHASLDDDLATLDGVLLAASAAAQIRTTRYVRTLLGLVSVALPVLVVTSILGMTLTSPLTGRPYGFTIGLAIAGVSFLIALFVSRRHRIV